MDHDYYYGSEEQDFWEGPRCTICGGPPAHLGSLGNLEWWRCRHCGAEYNSAE